MTYYPSGGNGGPGGGICNAGTLIVQNSTIQGNGTGNGADNRAITGLGFTPDLVIIKARTDPQVGVIRTSTMVGDLSKELTGGTALVANEIQSLDANGFTIGTDDSALKIGDVLIKPGQQSPESREFARSTTGADVREVVRRAVLEHGASFTQEQLADVALSGRWRANVNRRKYL